MVEHKMKSAVLALALLSLLLFAGVPMSVHAVATVKTADITAYTPDASAQWQTYDSANNVVWISYGVSASAVVKVDWSKVFTDIAHSVTQYTNLLGSACGGTRSDGPASSTLMGGVLYVTSWYGNQRIGITPVTNGVAGTTNCYSTGNPQDSRGIDNDGTFLYACAEKQIVKMTTGGTFTKLADISGDCTSVFVSGGVVYFTEFGSHGAGQMNADGTGAVTEYSCSCQGGTWGILVGADFYITDNRDHSLMKFTAGVLQGTYSYGGSADGPYGLAYSSAKSALLVDGNAYLGAKWFYPTNSSFGATPITTSKKPFQSFIDSNGNTGVLALGSTDLIQISTTANPCTSPVLSPAGNEAPTLMLNGTGPEIDSTGKATVTVPFYLYQKDALPKSFLGCGWVNDQAGFDALKVGGLAWLSGGSASVGPMTQLSNGTLISPIIDTSSPLIYGPVHHQGFLCATSKGDSYSSNWLTCSQSFVTVKTWASSITLPAATPCKPYFTTLYAWGQNGVGPNTLTLKVYSACKGA